MADGSSSPAPFSLSVLFVDDEPHNLTLAQMQFGEQYHVLTARSGPEALDHMKRETVGVVLTDERMPGMSGIELLSQVHARFPNTGRVIVSAYSDAERLLAAINKGHAHEYITKPWTGEELGACIERNLAVSRRRRALAAQAEVVEALASDLAAPHDPSAVVGAAAAFRSAVEAATKAARSDATVLVLGETGTGKELIARLVHTRSARAQGPFIRVNCGALAEGLLESELFGHEQGAFTGASRMKRGRFELADGGTLFLDEIGDISLKLQISLLRVLQERELERVGGTRTFPVDVRVVAATHRDLERAVREGRFREDLYYRLNVVPIRVPPLRERRQDIPALVSHFLAKHSPPGVPVQRKISDDAIRALERYSWPGNVRELENLVQRAMVLSDGEALELEDFCLRLSSGAPTDVRAQARDAGYEELRDALLAQGGNCARAARAMGIPRTTLVSRAKKMGLL